jgi:hypothetical protein
MKTTKAILGFKPLPKTEKQKKQKTKRKKKGSLPRRRTCNGRNY